MIRGRPAASMGYNESKAFLVDWVWILLILAAWLILSRFTGG